MGSVSTALDGLLFDSCVGQVYLTLLVRLSITTVDLISPKQLHFKAFEYVISE
jgi:hypothetical protein